MALMSLQDRSDNLKFSGCSILAVAGTGTVTPTFSYMYGDIVGSTIEWYSRIGVENQMNNSGTTYSYTAILK